MRHKHKRRGSAATASASYPPLSPASPAGPYLLSPISRSFLDFRWGRGCDAILAGINMTLPSSLVHPEYELVLLHRGKERHYATVHFDPLSNRGTHADANALLLFTRFTSGLGLTDGELQADGTGKGTLSPHVGPALSCHITRKYPNECIHTQPCF